MTKAESKKSKAKCMKRKSRKTIISSGFYMSDKIALSFLLLAFCLFFKFHFLKVK